MSDPIRVACPGCRNEIDPELCWCGDLIKDHNPYWCGHNPVPMGCVCGYEKEPVEDQVAKFKRDYPEIAEVLQHQKQRAEGRRAGV